MKVQVSNIKWDGNSSLSKRMVIEIPQEVVDTEDMEDYISDELSNSTGYCHFGFKYKVLS